MINAAGPGEPGIPFQTFPPTVRIGPRKGPACLPGGSHAPAERRMLRAHGEALVIRTSSLSGLEDGHGLLPNRHGAAWKAMPLLTGASLPDMVPTALDLLAESESGRKSLGLYRPLPPRACYGLGFGLGETR